MTWEVPCRSLAPVSGSPPAQKGWAPRGVPARQPQGPLSPPPMPADQPMSEESCRLSLPCSQRDAATFLEDTKEDGSRRIFGSQELLTGGRAGLTGGACGGRGPVHNRCGSLSPRWLSHTCVCAPSRGTWPCPLPPLPGLLSPSLPAFTGFLFEPSGTFLQVVIRRVVVRVTRGRC